MKPFMGPEAHFQRAIDQSHSLPHRTEQAEVRRWYADLLFRRNSAGDIEKANELLEQASRI